MNKALFAMGALLPLLVNAQTSNLLCVGGASVQVVRIDYAKQLVNGADATFDQDEIRWVSAKVERGRVWYTDHTLNRVAGTYKAWTRDAIYSTPPPLLRCEKAPEPKF